METDKQDVTVYGDASYRAHGAIYTRKRGQRENRKSALSIRGQTREKGAEQEGAGVRTGVREDEEERMRRKRHDIETFSGQPSQVVEGF